MINSEKILKEMVLSCIGHEEFHEGNKLLCLESKHGVKTYGKEKEKNQGNKTWRDWSSDWSAPKG